MYTGKKMVNDTAVIVQRNVIIENYRIVLFIYLFVVLK